MILREISSSEAWNRFVVSRANGSFLQSYQWGSVKSGTWIPFRLGLFNESDVLTAVALVLKRRLPFGFSLLYAPRGPLFSTHEAISPFLVEFTRWAAGHNAVVFKCDPEIPETDEHFVQALLQAGFRYDDENVQPRGTIILDLAAGAENLLKSFHHKTRYNIRLAEKKGVTVEQLQGDRAMRVFYELFRMTGERDRFMILRKSYFDHLWETLAPAGMCTVFAAFYEGRPLAAIVQTVFGGRMTYLYGASSNEYRNLMPNHLVHWRAIEWALSAGIRSYDLWGIPANPREGHPLWGVYRFKKGFSETETRWIGTYNLVFKPLTNRVLHLGIRTVKSFIRFIRTGKWGSSLEE